MRLSVKKQVAFAALTVAGFFVLAELLLWIAGVQPVAYDEDPYVGFSSSRPLFIEEKGPDGQVYLRTARYRLRLFNDQSFPKRKPRDAYRIFSLGGSTTYGRPYTDPISFSGWLREFLPVADPARTWEVINAGGISYASYRLSVLMEELLAYEPDLFLIYTGQNEFLEQRSYGHLANTPRFLITLAGWASRTRLYAAGRLLLGSFGESALQNKTVLGGEVDTILQHSVGPEDYRRDDPLHGQIFEHFRYNLNRMVDMARSAGADVVFITPVSNLKDCSPFKSQPRDGLDPESEQRFAALMKEAAKAGAAQDWENAARLLTQARAIDNRYAELHYRLGQALYQLDRHDESEAALRQAVEEDVCPLRAPGRISEIISDTAERKSAALVDFATAIRRRSPHGIPGSELFLDHVHPNAEGYGLLALEIIETLTRVGVIRPSNSWNNQNVASASRRVLARLDRRAYGESLRNLAKVFDWAGKYEDADRLGRQAAEVLGADAEIYGVLGHAALIRGDREAAVRYLGEAVRIRPDYADAHFDLGTALHLEGRYQEAVGHFHLSLLTAPDVDGDTHNNLGLSLQALGDLEGAASEFRAALSVNPDKFDAHSSLGDVLLAQGRAGEAIEHYRRAAQLETDSATPLQRLAWLLATHPDESTRDGNQAVRLAERAAELTGFRDPGVLDALAASYAETGRFQEAVKTIERALALHETAGAVDEAGELRLRRELYEKRLPYRMP